MSDPGVSNLTERLSILAAAVKARQRIQWYSPYGPSTEGPVKAHRTISFAKENVEDRKNSDTITPHL